MYSTARTDMNIIIKTNTLLLTTICFFIHPQTLQADVYQWTDAQGKVHFSDIPPVQNAKIIEPDGDVNIMDNANALIQKQKIRTANDEVILVEQHNRKIKEQNRKQKRMVACSKAQKRLETLQGPVYFTDTDTGKSYDVSIDEQKRLINEQQKHVNRLCHQ